MSKLEELINIIVNRQIKRFSDLEHAFGKLNTDTIWTNSYYTIQLQYAMEEKMKLLFGDDTKDVVREIIRHYHLKVIERIPELKEY